jgi:hypothetical protein
MFFQIHKNGRAVDGSSYPSLEQAVAALGESGARRPSSRGLCRSVAEHRASSGMRCPATLASATSPTPGTTFLYLDVIRLHDGHTGTRSPGPRS